jgi:hypothetical protein
VIDPTSALQTGCTLTHPPALQHETANISPMTCHFRWHARQTCASINWFDNNMGFQVLLQTNASAGSRSNQHAKLGAVRQQLAAQYSSARFACCAFPPFFICFLYFLMLLLNTKGCHGTDCFA